MEIVFRNRELLNLLQKGKSRKYRLSDTAVEKLESRIEVLEAATGIYDLWQAASLHFEKMKGYDTRFSVRIDKKYRLEFNIEWTDIKKTTGKVIIINISKHYE